MSRILGAAASGHKETTKAASVLLEEGGNAFDAALGAMCAACVCEPMLASLGGGGFLLAGPADAPVQVFDFFTQTPSAVKKELDFFPIQADFGTATQEFHIGMGSIAVPGVVAGLFAVHGSLCRMPLEKIIEPAVRLAREGVRLNALQRFVSEILQPIIMATPGALAMAAPVNDDSRIAEIGEFVANPELADSFESLAENGPQWFYQGEPGQQLVADCAANGGLVTAADLQSYKVIRRKSLMVESHGARIHVNSPPSPGGCLILFAMSLLDKSRPGQHAWGGVEHATALAKALQASSLVRESHGVSAGLDQETAHKILGREHISEWHGTLKSGAIVSRGTTHISIADADGNMASLTLSNGEGSSYVMPGCGIMLNNMMGEQDLHPDGFHRSPPGIRLASMMTPTIADCPDGSRIALGSGGSNRIRSAILQVLTNLLDFDMDLQQAVVVPRLHLEGDNLSLEKGFSADAIETLARIWPSPQLWPDPNLFFGGVHAVERCANGEFRAAGDPRRGGAATVTRNR